MFLRNGTHVWYTPLKSLCVMVHMFVKVHFNVCVWCLRLMFVGDVTLFLFPLPNFCPPTVLSKLDSYASSRWLGKLCVLVFESNIEKKLQIFFLSKIFWFKIFFCQLNICWPKKVFFYPFFWSNFLWRATLWRNLRHSFKIIRNWSNRKG